MSRRTPYLLLALLALAVVLATAAGCGSGGDREFKGHGISFNYPSDWAPAESQGAKVKTSSGLWTEMFAPSAAAKDAGGTTADIVFLTEFETSVAVTKKSLAASASSITASVAQVAKKAGGALLGGPSVVTMGGMPGYEYRISAETIKGRKSESRLVIVWNGKTEYSLNCQHLVSGTRADEIEKGCKMIVDSFKLD
ncbi:MAG: hypothetical protein ACYDHO_00735 [Gaiellaceae bacterium]